MRARHCSAPRESPEAVAPSSCRADLSIGRRCEPGARAWAWRLQEDLVDFDRDNEAWRFDRMSQQVGDSMMGEQRADTLHKTLASTDRYIDLGRLHRPMAQVSALKLIGLVCPHLFEGDGDAAVI